ncbi:MAG: C4-type zinc ribbon domain-containing protein [Candidatus Theseobacter exili]|nr:C4-type zinc ribbon domain-containing protein [Candidatus Theseobacter exili]
MQKLDIKIFRLNKKKKELPAKLKSLKNKLAEQQKLIDDKQHVIKNALVQRNSLEVDLASKAEVRKKLEVKLMAVRTNQEYKAVEKEIFGIKADCSLVEDKILENMVEVEKLQNEAKEFEREIESLQKQIKAKEKEIEKEIVLAEKELATLNSDRSTKTSEIDAPHLKRYERIAKRFPGTAIVPVLDKTCQGCHMLLTPQVISNIHNIDLFNICESCSRILYLPEEESETEKKE